MPKPTPKQSLSLTLCLEWGEALDLLFLLDIQQSADTVSVRNKLRAAMLAAKKELDNGNQD